MHLHPNPKLEKLPENSLHLCPVQLHVSFSTRNNQVFSSEQLFPFKHCYIVQNDISRPLLLCLSCRFQWSCCPCGAGVQMAWQLPRTPGTGSCGRKLSFWLHPEYAEAECGAEGFASLPGWQEDKRWCQPLCWRSFEAAVRHLAPQISMIRGL